ncbi:MAG: biopolymer transporter ExbD [Deltaproteobacteria bacterium]|nr:biopolymer transporter ExbD [Deltaproteobacteria bacterium]
MNEKEFDTINVIPLVDVMLVLLTIVLATSTFIVVGSLPVELPKAASSSRESPRAAFIEIDRQGNLLFDSRPTTLAALRGSLEALARTRPVTIRADRHIALQVFIDVMDLVKGLGFTAVTLQTEAAL